MKVSATKRTEKQSSDGNSLTMKQERALVALLEHGTLEAAAESAGINKTTLWRMMQLEVFQDAFRASRRQVIETAIAKLQAGCAVAVGVLLEVAGDSAAPASARVSAAKTILDQSFTALEVSDTNERIKRLEELQHEPKTETGATRSTRSRAS